MATESVTLSDAQRRVIVYALHMLHANLDDQVEEDLALSDVDICQEIEAIEVNLGVLPPSVTPLGFVPPGT